MAMGLWSRLKLIFKAKGNKALDRAEDPREMLDYSYQRQLELLQGVRRGAADVATARARIEMQATQLRQTADKLQDQAKMALEQNREDLAREALSRRVAIAKELSDLQIQHEQLKAQEDKMIESSRQVEARLEAFRTRKETMKAQYTAAEARSHVQEAAAGLEEMGDLGLAVQRAEDKIAQAQARAGALEGLMASGALEDLSQPTDRIQAELDKTATDSEVELELSRLKGELGMGASQSTVTVDPTEAGGVDAQSTEGSPA
jgi:phage shock protein A